MRIITFALCLFALTPVIADDALPFGIRPYDIGMAPDFTLKDIDGETFTLSSTRGDWVFLHFWASWCGPCREEMPTIEKMMQTFDDDKLKVIMVNMAENDDTIFTFLGTIGVEATTLMDTEGVITAKYKPRGLPTTFLIDPEGVVRYQAIGGREWQSPEYLAFLDRLIGQ